MILSCRIEMLAAHPSNETGEFIIEEPSAASQINSDVLQQTNAHTTTTSTTSTTTTNRVTTNHKTINLAAASSEEEPPLIEERASSERQTATAVKAPSDHQKSAKKDGEKSQKINSEVIKRVNNDNKSEEKNNSGASLSKSNSSGRLTTAEAGVKSAGGGQARGNSGRSRAVKAGSPPVVILEKPTEQNQEQGTVCLRSLDPFYILSTYTYWVKTSWTQSNFFLCGFCFLYTCLYVYTSPPLSFW